MKRTPWPLLLLAATAVLSCMPGSRFPSRFEGRPGEWLQMQGDGQKWRLLAVEDESDHYAEIIALGELPEISDGLILGNLPLESVATRKPLLWTFRVERRLDYGPVAEDPVGTAARALREQLEASCSAPTWKSLHRSPGDELFEWHHEGCAGSRPEHELVRFLAGARGLHRASLRARGQRIPVEMRRDWLGILLAARLAGR